MQGMGRKLLFFAYGYPIVPRPFVEKAIPSPFNCYMQTKVICLHICGFICRLSILSHWLICLFLYQCWASQVAQWVKNPPATQETQVRSLAWEDPLEEGMATHSSILAWSIPWTEEPGGLSPQPHKEWDTTKATEHTSTQSNATLSSTL